MFLLYITLCLHYLTDDHKKAKLKPHRNCYSTCNGEICEDVSLFLRIQANMRITLKDLGLYIGKLTLSITLRELGQSLN